VKAVYRDLFRHSLIYGLAPIFGRLASLLLLPLYTHYLRPADYGCIYILDLATGVLGVLIGAGMTQGVNRYHFEARDEAERDRLWWTGLTFLALMGLALIAPVWVWRGELAQLTLGNDLPEGGYYFALALVTLWFTVVSQLPNTYLRVRKWSALAVVLSMGRLLVNIALNIYFLAAWQMGVAGVLLGNLITTVLVTLLLVGIMGYDRGSYQLQLAFVPKLWRFGVPLVFSALLAMVMDQGDRQILQVYSGRDAVGLYGLACTMGKAAYSLVLMPFSMIWGVVIYEVAEDPHAKEIYTRVFEYVMIGLMLLMLAASLFARPVVALMAASDYQAAADLVPPICLATLFFSLQEHFKVPALLAKQTASLVPAYLCASVTTLGGNLLLIPRLGAVGAAWMCVVTAVVFSFVGLWRFRKIDRYDYPFARCGLLLLGMIGTYVVYRSLEGLDWPHWGLLLTATLLWLGWIAVLAATYLRELPLLDLLRRRRARAVEALSASGVKSS
jgi:O-antigen/teichoic acid export membrane protein